MDATEDDGTCDYAAEGFDCDGNCLETFTLLLIAYVLTMNISDVDEFDESTCTFMEMCDCECIDADENGICDDEETVSQSINLVEGWSMWSTYI